MRLLVAYSLNSCFTKTVVDYIDAIREYSKNDVYYVNVTDPMPPTVNLQDFDAVFHTYSARLVYDGLVSKEYLEQLTRFNGVKVLAVQDEYDRTHLFKKTIKLLGFDVVLTCVPQAFIDAVYPKSEFPNVRFESVLTGYASVADVEHHQKIQPIAERPITIGYRGRDIGGRYGRLGFEKFEIGRRMKEICEGRGIACDIAMDEDSRIYGEQWLKFVGNCRTMLGSESGSNIFDFDGTIERRFQEWIKSNGRTPTYEDFRSYTDPLESRIEMGQISPRIFECALMRTPMILFRGRYSGALEADEHYIPLEKDFSNIDNVLLRLGDLEDLEGLAERAYSHLVSSGRFGYRSFVSRLDEILYHQARNIRHHTVPDTQAAPSETSRNSNRKDYIVSVTRVPIKYDDQVRYMLPEQIGEIRLLLTQSDEKVARYIGSVQIFGQRVARCRNQSNETRVNIDGFCAAVKQASGSVAAIRKEVDTVASADLEAVKQADLQRLYGKCQSILSDLYKINNDLAAKYRQVDRLTLISAIAEEVEQIRSLLDQGETNVSGYAGSERLFQQRLDADEKQSENARRNIREFSDALNQAAHAFATIRKEVDSVASTDLEVVGQEDLNLLYGKCQSNLSELYKINNSLQEKHPKNCSAFKHLLVRVVSSLRSRLTDHCKSLMKI